MPEDLVLLHGFGGTRRTWDGVIACLSAQRYRALALDLPGHGEHAVAPRPIGFRECVEHVLEMAPERFALCGYSMGGRVALQVALTAPERVARLVLISCDPGIEDPVERAARRRSDEALARELEGGSYEQFIERWRTQPLFAEDPPRVDSLAREELRRNSPDALAAVLRGLGTGEMEPLWTRLSQLRMPVCVLAGERDAKFRAIGQRTLESLPVAELTVLPGGHGLALASPQAVASVLERFGSRQPGSDRARPVAHEDADAPLVDVFET